MTRTRIVEIAKRLTARQWAEEYHYHIDSVRRKCREGDFGEDAKKVKTEGDQIGRWYIFTTVPVVTATVGD